MALVYVLLFLSTVCWNLPPGKSFSIVKNYSLLEDHVSEAEDDYRFYEQILRPFLRVRVPGTEGNLAVQQHIIRTMSSLGWRIDRDSFVDDTPFGKRRFSNIVATFNPDAERRLALACHFDSKYFKEFRFIGATDAAVPCAMMLDLAIQLNNTLYSSSRKHSTTLQLLFFDGEEAFNNWSERDSLYGSRHLATAMDETPLSSTTSWLSAMDVLILLDLIGTRDTQFVSWFSTTDLLYEQLREIENFLRAKHLLRTDEDDGTTATYFTDVPFSAKQADLLQIQDDQLPFQVRGVPVLHLISYPFPQVWHTEFDNEAALHLPTIRNIELILRTFLEIIFQ